MDSDSAVPTGPGPAAGADTDPQTIEAMQTVFSRQRAAYDSDPYPDAAARRQDLDRLRTALLRHRDALVSAVDRDFGGRARQETLTADIIPSLNSIRHTRRHLKRWMRSRRRWPHPLMQPAGARIEYQPLGVVGVMVPWNYPVFLSLGPLVSALGAGNRVMIKLSEFTPETNQVLRALLADAFNEDQVAVVLGDVPVSQAFSELPFDHLLFTGSTDVGRKVMAAAARNLTPLTLELGGKSPAIVDRDAPMGASVERLLFGKLVNAGQTCIAPDYVLCVEDRVEELISAIQKTTARLFPGMRNNPDYTSIINSAQHRRLLALLDDARQRGARVLEINPAGESFEGSRKLPLHLVLDTPADARVLQEELFGPILPIIPVADLDAALERIAAGPRPLALYYFGQDRKRQQQVLQRSHSGGVCLNDTLMHVAQDELPFGGVGESGMGHYHGHHGFLTFSKEKAVFSRGRINSARLIYPPYGGRLQQLIQRLMLR
ncbi:MAG: coniferyl aldehyde dehydrogenase [Ectothiorhodospiraceae bacterium]|nr:coniferyl aldehyde dehydrogenase [Ectothiorhodospiraceae bacterium]